MKSSTIHIILLGRVVAHSDGAPAVAYTPNKLLGSESRQGQFHFLFIDWSPQFVYAKYGLRLGSS